MKPGNRSTTGHGANAVPDKSGIDKELTGLFSNRERGLIFVILMDSQRMLDRRMAMARARSRRATLFLS